MTPVRPPHTPIRSICGARSMDLAGAALSRRNRAGPADRGRGCAAALPPHRGRDVEDWAWQQARPAGHDGGAGSACRGDYSLAWFGGAVRADDHRRFGRRVGRFDRSGARQACRGTGGNGESLYDVAVRVAPNAPTRQVADRIRELNGLQTPALAVGQTLIAPVG